MSSQKIGQFIKQCRKEKKLTQEALGEKLGVSSKSISRWENNITMPDLSLLTNIAKELEIEVSELLNGKKMSIHELIELRSTVDKLIKYSNYEYRSRYVHKKNWLIVLIIFIALLIICNTIWLILPIPKSLLTLIINLILLMAAFFINFFALYYFDHTYDFKVDNMILSDKDN